MPAQRSGRPATPCRRALPLPLLNRTLPPWRLDHLVGLLQRRSIPPSPHQRRSKASSVAYKHERPSDREQVGTCSRTRSVLGKIFFGTQTRRKKNDFPYQTGSSHGLDVAKHAGTQHFLPKRGACAIVGARGAPAPDDDVGGRPVAARVWHWFSACAWWTEGASDP